MLQQRRISQKSEIFSFDPISAISNSARSGITQPGSVKVAANKVMKVWPTDPALQIEALRLLAFLADTNPGALHIEQINGVRQAPAAVQNRKRV